VFAAPDEVRRPATPGRRGRRFPGAFPCDGPLGAGFWYDRAFSSQSCTQPLHELSGLPLPADDVFPELDRITDKVVFGSDWPGMRGSGATWRDRPAALPADGVRNPGGTPPAAASLARISHTLLTAAAITGMSTALRSSAPRRSVNYVSGPSVARLVSTPVSTASLRTVVRNAG